MKYYDEQTQTWKDVQIKVANAVKNEYGTSQSDCYSQKYINDNTYTQDYLDDHTINVGVNDTDYRVNFIKGNNIFDDILESGWISGQNGTDAANNDFVRGKNGVLVNSNTQYTLSLSINVNQIAVMFYNGSTFISSSASTDGTSTNLYTFTTPANCNRLRVRFRSTDLTNNVMINEGDTALPYEPYITPSIYLDNEMLVSKNVYSGGEVVIGEWLGKPLYRKVIDFGALPNNTNKAVNSNISNLSEVIKVYASARRSDKTAVLIPYTLGNESIGIYYGNDNSVHIVTSTDRSAFTCQVIVEYTKTSGGQE